MFIQSQAMVTGTGIRAGDRRRLELRTALVVLLMQWLNPGPVSGLSRQPCSFSSSCSCAPSASSLPEIHCFAAPLLRIPVLPIGHYYRVSIAASPEIHSLPGGVFEHGTVSFFTLTGSKLTRLDSTAFSGTENTLTTLDLSENRLNHFPVAALAQLPLLQWLSLKGNEIEEIRAVDMTMKTNDSSIERQGLRTLLLSDNRLSVIHDGTFLQLHELQSLDLAGNMITKIEGRPFPASLTSLSLSQNLLETVPSNALSNLIQLRWLQLRGNLISSVPAEWFLPASSIEILDLSHNLLQSLTRTLFMSHKEKDRRRSSVTHEPEPPHNQTVVSIGDLHLDFNVIQELDAGTLENVSIRRLSLSNNKLSSLPDHLFDGLLRDSLQALDLNFNLFSVYPDSLKRLRRITSLFLRGNQLQSLDQDSFIGCKDHLQSLDLSSNSFVKIPALSLRQTTRLLRLNLQDNLIRKIHEQELSVWATGLLSLSLSKNDLHEIHSAAFKYTKSLKELRLSFNRIQQASIDALRPLRQRLAILELTSAVAAASDSRIVSSVASLYNTEWLELDLNSLTSLSNDSFSGVHALAHLDLEGNRITDLPAGLFQANVHKKLRNVLLSDNNIRSLGSQTFEGLDQLVNVAIARNGLKEIKRHAFKDLAQLQSISLNKNAISSIAFAAFSNTTQLRNVLLQHNRLRHFCLDIFSWPTMNVSLADSGDESQEASLEAGKAPGMSINVSHNEISELGSCSPERGMIIQEEIERAASSVPVVQQTRHRLRILDVSYNSLSQIPLLDSFCDRLDSLFLSHNGISRIGLHSFRKCKHLQTLTLNNNLISSPDCAIPPHPPGQNDSTNEQRDCGSFLPSLQILNLAHNRIHNISVFANFFANLSNLKMLDLAFNAIQSLDGSAFTGTSIEKLLLTGNGLKELHGQWLWRGSLTHMDLSHNDLTAVPSILIVCHNLSSLLLSYNKISDLREGSFSRLTNLKELSLSGNKFTHLSSRSFATLVNLLSLDMRDCGMVHSPEFSLPKLVELNLQRNMLSNMSSNFLSTSRNIKKLNLSHNQLPDVPRSLFRFVPDLIELDISYNPIEVLDSASLSNLLKLRHLDMTGLTLKYMDSRVLHALRHLISIKTSTYPSVRSFRLHDLLAKSTSLRSVSVSVQETILSHQVQYSFSPKLKELIITGQGLLTILPDAFIGLSRSSGLVLRITGTGVKHLPSGLLRLLDNRLSVLDIRHNRLTSLSADVLQPPVSVQRNSADANHWYSFSNGLLLDDNPWICSCELAWLSDWLRRWAKEMRRSQMFEAALFSSMTDGSCVTVARSSDQRSAHSDSKRVPLIEFRANLFGCDVPSSAAFSAIDSSAITPALILVVSAAFPLMSSSL